MKKFILSLLVLTFVFSTLAQLPEQKPNTYVHDYIGVLSPTELEDLNQRILAIDTSTSVEIAVVLINELPLGYPDISSFTLNIGRTWGVGKAQNGLVYAMVLGDRRMRLEVGSRLEGSITDVDALNITDATKPELRRKEYYGAMVTLLEQIKSYIPVEEQQTVLREYGAPQSDTSSSEVIIVILVLIVLLIWATWFSYKRGKRLEKEDSEKRQEQLLKFAAAREKEDKPAAILRQLYEEGDKRRPLVKPHTTMEQQSKPRTTRRTIVTPPVIVPYTPPETSSSNEDSNRSTYTAPEPTPDYGNFTGNDAFQGGGADNSF